MARISIESAKSIIGTLLNEQERDRDNLQRMLSHSQKMSEALALMRDQEEHRIDTEAAERKANLRRLFGQLLAVEDERKERLALQIAEIEGNTALADKPLGGAKDQLIAPGSPFSFSDLVDH
jgi:hypothetical protein